MFNAAAAQLNIGFAKAILESLKKGNINIVAGQWGSPIEAVLSANEPNLSDGDVRIQDMMDLLLSKGFQRRYTAAFGTLPCIPLPMLILSSQSDIF